MRNYLLLLLLRITIPAQAQLDTNIHWTWISGTNQFDQLGVYGTKGVESAIARPGARTYGITWTDSSGYLWLWGGHGFAASGTSGPLNDVWRFNTSNNQWTWIRGADTTNSIGSASAVGISSPTNDPPAGQFSTSWTDMDGNLWIYSGEAALPGSATLYSQMWTFNSTTHKWILVDQRPVSSSVYGQKGLASFTNTPAKRNSPATWTDPSGNFWLFSGNERNDFWRFSPTTRMWTWMYGDSGKVAHNYGTITVESPSNKPPGRAAPKAWMDNAGRFWVTSGYTNLCFKNDLWRFNPQNGYWTWMKGVGVVDICYANPGEYGSKGVPANANTPPGRILGNTWKAANGELWLFGGSSSPINGLYLGNDLWKYNVTLNQWAWMAGDNSPDGKANFGTMGVPHANNKPGSRKGAMSWLDQSGNVYVFGGWGYTTATYSNAFLNDMWRYNITTYTFTGNGDWNNPANWIGNKVPPVPVSPTSIINITPTAGGNCTYTGTLYISQKAILNIPKASSFTVNGNIVFE